MSQTHTLVGAVHREVLVEETLDAVQAADLAAPFSSAWIRGAP
jgi:hypothetical protein